MNTALLYTTGSNNEWELEFIVELDLPEKLEPYTDGEIVCHIYPEEDNEINLSMDSLLAAYLSHNDRLKRLNQAIRENFQKALDVQEEEENWIYLNY